MGKYTWLYIVNILITLVFLSRSYAGGEIASPLRLAVGLQEFGDNGALFLNPASMASNAYVEGNVGIYSSLTAKRLYQFLNLNAMVGMKNHIGFSVIPLNKADDSTKLASYYYDYKESAYAVGYSRQIKLNRWRFLNFGVQGSIIRTGLTDSTARREWDGGLGVVLDQKGLNWGSFKLGLSVNHLLQPELDLGSGVKARYPLEGAVSLALDAFDNKLEFTSQALRYSKDGFNFADNVRVSQFLTSWGALSIRRDIEGQIFFGFLLQALMDPGNIPVRLHLDISHGSILNNKPDEKLIFTFRMCLMVISFN